MNFSDSHVHKVGSDVGRRAFDMQDRNRSEVTFPVKMDRNNEVYLANIYHKYHAFLEFYVCQNPVGRNSGVRGEDVGGCRK